MKFRKCVSAVYIFGPALVEKGAASALSHMHTHSGSVRNEWHEEMCSA